MNSWKSPDFANLARFATESRGAVLLCSPFVSKPALDVVLHSLPANEVSRVDVWTRMSTRDYLTGASDPEGLLDFLEQALEKFGAVSLRHSQRLHAKMYLSDGPIGLAGSANLTAGGFVRNQEVVHVLGGQELSDLREFSRSILASLNSMSLDLFRDFVSRCNSLHDTKEALLGLIREETSVAGGSTGPLIPYSSFLEFVEQHGGDIAEQILLIARNADGNNNTGKIKQAFYGVQRFLQENPHYISQVSQHPTSEWFDVGATGLVDKWRDFLRRFQDEESNEFGYSIPTLRGYLTATSGGHRTGGGGGDNQLKRVWPFVARLMDENN